MTLSCIKRFKLGLFGMKLGTQHYSVYFIVLKWLESKTTVLCFKLRVKLRFWGFLSVFGTFPHKVVKLGLFGAKHGTQYYSVYIIVLNRFQSKTIVICLKLCAKMRFWVFLNVFVTFSYKTVETRLVWH